ncbi:T7SS effector LXG polymorphic toxin [Ureibacillus composti]
MKVLDAEELHAGLKRNIEMLHRLEGEMQGIEKAIKDLTQMEESLKGQGGEALRTFYAQCYLPFLQYFMTFKDSFINILEQMCSALSSLEPDQTGFIEQSYLEVEVEQGMNQYPDEHQAGIHGKGAPSGKLFPRR